MSLPQHSHTQQQKGLALSFMTSVCHAFFYKHFRFQNNLFFSKGVSYQLSSYNSIIKPNFGTTKQKIDSERRHRFVHHSNIYMYLQFQFTNIANNFSHQEDKTRKEKKKKQNCSGLRESSLYSHP